jgi:hypothetical protein
VLLGFFEISRDLPLAVLKMTEMHGQKTPEVPEYKARFCAGGHRQIEGVDFFETFAPVVNWTTVLNSDIYAS